MKDFIDKTTEQSGTPINRANLMSIQGFVSSSVTYENGVRTIMFANGENLKTRLDGNSVIETFTGEKTITKTTSLLENGYVTEVIS